MRYIGWDSDIKICIILRSQQSGFVILQMKFII